MYKTGCIKDGGKRKILKGFPKETIELSEEHPKPFCGKLMHFYHERISILFYCEVGKRGAVS
jgi:hypothetical protein